MSHPSGQADLPLHRGRVPRWLASRMERLGRVMVEALLLTYGRDEVLRRLSHPFWFHDKLFAIRRLDRQARQLERTGDGFDVEGFIKQERRLSSRYGGRTIHGPAPKTRNSLAEGTSGLQRNLPGLL